LLAAIGCEKVKDEVHSVVYDFAKFSLADNWVFVGPFCSNLLLLVVVKEKLALYVLVDGFGNAFVLLEPWCID